jgi:hypothetical protein
MVVSGGIDAGLHCVGPGRLDDGHALSTAD